MGAYAQCAERLIERGFAAVPIMPGTKRPGHFVLRHVDRPRQLAEAFQRRPAAGERARALGRGRHR